LEEESREEDENSIAMTARGLKKMLKSKRLDPKVL